MLVRILKIALSLVMVDAIFAGCSGTRGNQSYEPEPYYEPEPNFGIELEIRNYQQLQQELADICDASCFPDFSQYQDLSLYYSVVYDEIDLEEKIGYSIDSVSDYGSTTPTPYYGSAIPTPTPIAQNSLITYFQLRCISESHRPSYATVPETSYRGIPYQYVEITYFEYIDGSDLQNGLPYYPSFYYASSGFSVDGYDYTLYVLVELPFEAYTTMSIADANEQTEKARAEVMAIIDSILDQKGLPQPEESTDSGADSGTEPGADSGAEPGADSEAPAASDGKVVN